MYNTPTSIAFTPEDLEYNRRGELSPLQRQKDRERGAGCLWRLGAFMGACALIAFPAFVLKVRWMEGVGMGAVIFGGQAALVFVGLLVLSLLPMKIKVSAVRGPLEVVVDRTTVNAHKYYIVVGDVSFPADPQLPGIFQQGAAYAIYYSAGKVILSYERLDGFAPRPATPPLAAPTDVAARLAALEDLRARGLVTGDQYAEKRAEILASL